MHQKSMLYEIFFELHVSDGEYGEICAINIITKAQAKVQCNQGWPETRGHSKQVNNLVLLKNQYSLNFFHVGQDWRTFLRAQAQTTV